MIRSVLGKILLYALLVAFVVTYGHEYGFNPFNVSATGQINELFMYLILGGIFRIVYDILRRVISLLTRPLSWITLGLVGTILNIAAIYAFIFTINALPDLGIFVEMGTPLEIILFSLIVRVIDFIF